MGINKKGFTLIEMVIVIALMGLVLPALFAIVFAVLQQQAKIMRLSEVKRQGNYALNVMQTTIRNNALDIYNSSDTLICNTQTGNTSYDIDEFSDRTGLRFYFQYNSATKAIDYKPAGNPLTSLTNSKVQISNFALKCRRSNQFSPAIASISFTISYNSNGSTRAEENATLQYRTNVKLRNY